MANIPNTRRGNTVVAHIKLKDGGMLIPWSDFSGIRVDAYSVEQRMLAAQCEAVVNEDDDTILDVTYSGDSMQYLGLCKVIVRGIYDSRKKTYDAPLVNFVADTAQATGVIVVTDPEVNVLIDVQEVSTSVLDEAIAAAIAAAEHAEETASKSPYIDDTTGNWMVYNPTTGEYVDSEIPATGPQGPQGVSPMEFGTGEHSAYLDGSGSVASGQNSVAIGTGTTASGKGATSEGNATVASGDNSHAEGDHTNATGGKSHAEGRYTEAQNTGEHAEGHYNVSIPNKTRHTVGIGTANNARKNAHTITNDGKHYIPGIGGYEGTENTAEALAAKQDLAAVIATFITKSVSDLTNYYLKSETYSKTEVDAIVAALYQFHFEVYASLEAITSPSSNVLYLIGPTGSGADKYEEYVYSNSTFVKIGDTSIDLSGYVTTTALNAALATKVNVADIVDNLTTNDATKPLSAKQGKVLGEQVSQLGQEINYPTETYTDITAEVTTIFNGCTLSSTPGAFNYGEDRSIRYIRTYSYQKRIKKLRVTANANYGSAFSFAKYFNPNNSYLMAEGETGIRVANVGTSLEVDVPRNTITIIFNNASGSQTLFSAKIEAVFSEVNGGSLADNERIIGQSNYLLSIKEGKYYNRDTVFTSKDVNVGDLLSLSVFLDTALAITEDLCYIAFYDNNNNSLGYIGKGSTFVAPVSRYDGTFKITSDFAYAKVATSLKNGCLISVSNDARSKQPDKIGGRDRYANYTEVNLANCDSVTNCYIFEKVWDVSNAQSGRIWKIVPVPDGTKFMKIESDSANNTIFVHDYDAPAQGLMPDYADLEKKVYALKNDDVFLPAGTKYVLIHTHNTTIDISPSYVGFAETRPSITGGVDESIDNYVIGREIENVSCPDAAEVVMASDDETATQYDNSLLGYFNVVKVADDLFYMYYSCIGKEENWINDNSQHLAFAYSADGENWTRGIPSGIQAPNPGTNLLFTEKVIGVQVFKVQDRDYPFRMLASYNRDETVMYKSADGVNFTKIRTVFPYYCDNQVSCIVRGDIVKVYIRWRSNINGTSTTAPDYRFIGVCTLDINGNVIAPPTIFFGLNLYQASASVLDDRREIAFPTRYLLTPNDTQSIQCFIIDGKKVFRRNFDTANLIANDELSFYVAPGLVNIGSEMYLYMSARTAKHNSFSQATTVCRIKRVRVQFDVEGRAWIYKNP